MPTLANTSSMLLHRHLVENENSTKPMQAEKKPELEVKKEAEVNTQPIAESEPKKAKKTTKKAK